VLCVADAESALAEEKTAEKRVHVRLFRASSLLLLAVSDRGWGPAGCDSTDRNSQTCGCRTEETDAAAASEACNLRCKLSGI
jgi:hypothetical protein